VRCLCDLCSKEEKIGKMVENEADVTVEEYPPLVYVTTVSPVIDRSVQYIPPQPQEEWNCTQCTLRNPARKLYCIACFHRHPDLTPLNVGSIEDFDDDYDYDYDDDDGEEHPPFLRNDRQMTDNNVITRDMDNRIVSSQIVLDVQAEEDPFQKKARRQMRRKRRMMAGGAMGVVVGAVLGGPALVVAGMVGGAVGTRFVSKHKERLKDERLATERYTMETKAQTTP